MTILKTPDPPPRAMSSQEVAEQTAEARKAATMRAIQTLRPREVKVIRLEEDGRTEIRVKQ